jgi:hypothetical protein
MMGRGRWSLAIGSLVILGLGAQPALRWSVSNTLSRFVNGSVRLDGALSWSIQDHTLTLHDLHMQKAGRQAMQARRVVAKIDAQEFLRRNLVIDSAIVEGASIRMEPPSASAVDSAQQHDLVSVPPFPSSQWLENRKTEIQTGFQSVAEERLLVRRRLAAQCDRLRDQIPNELSDDPHPWSTLDRNDGLRQGIHALRQSLAEERVKVREIDRAWERESTELPATWRDAFQKAIAASLPDPQTAARRYVEAYASHFVRSHHPYLSVALHSVHPVSRITPRGAGTDVTLPGIPDNFTQVRQASLKGAIHPTAALPIPFEATLQHWGDPNGNTPPPQSEWRFQASDTNNELVVRSRVVSSSADRASPTLIALNITRAKDTDASQGTSLRWIRASTDADAPTLLHIETPLLWCDMGLSPDPLNAEWQICLKAAFQKGEPPLIRGEVRFESPRESHWSFDGEFACDPTCLMPLPPIWLEAQDRFIASTLENVAHQFQPAIEEELQRRSGLWLNLARDHHQALNGIEREINELRAELEKVPPSGQRISRMP